MARYKDASCRLCRREGGKLFLKGSRCYTDKCSITRREWAPGQHGQQRKKVSEYGVQLREKQKVRRFYGILESQFRQYFDKAVKKRGITGELLLQFCETRLDNTVYRAGLASSRAEARQLVTHGHVEINGRKLDIPSYSVSVGDTITVREKSKSMPKIKGVVDSSRPVPKWLEFSAEKLSGKVLALPSREDVDLLVKEHLIVELYSK